jgi:hypothetical protein
LVAKYLKRILFYEALILELGHKSLAKRGQMKFLIVTALAVLMSSAAYGERRNDPYWPHRVTPAPEPSSLGMLAIGLMGVTGYVLYRRRQAAN